ncbi:hypothetical protein Leryth_021653 [Lithospermum erythrorhizon]|nr:hypothetical protein Leryth_021653 [Lithospermum erythrorhizon]
MPQELAGTSLSLHAEVITITVSSTGSSRILLCKVEILLGLAEVGWRVSCNIGQSVKDEMEGSSPFSKFEDEINPQLKHTGAGILSMANAGPNTNGRKHTIFGRVSKGMEIIKRLGSVQTDNTDRPIHDVRILRTSVRD